MLSFIALKGKHNIPKKIAFIYGENGAGKSNLMSSFLFLYNTFDTLKYQEKLKKLCDNNLNDIISTTTELTRKKIFAELFKQQSFSIEDLIKEYKMLGATENLKLEFGFYLEGKEGTYSLEFNDTQIINETLKFVIKERSGEIFSINSNNIRLNNSIFLI
jgi:AAA15 family ATPase/GTPase